MILDKKVINGFIWTFAERFGAQFVSLAVSIVIARFVGPEAYGSIALVLVFINIANVFVTSGLGNSLVQSQEADETDFSTVFIFNFLFSLVLYFVFFSCAPLLARYYRIPELKLVIRVMGIRIIIAAVNSVQRAYVSRKMLFKRFFYSTLSGTIISAFVGIFCAYNGYGVWALVAQYLTNSCIDTIVLWYTIDWRPKLSFSIQKLRRHFSFGWKLLCSSFLSSLYIEMTNLIIGKVYGPSDLAYFDKGKKFPQLIVTQVNSAIDTVLFPAMSKVQDDLEKLKELLRSSISLGTYCIFPIVMGLAAIGETLIVILLSEKWISSVVFLRIACLSFAFLPINIANIQVLKAMGRSDIYLKLDVCKKIIGIVLLAFMIKKGVVAIACVELISNIICVVINVYPNRKLLNYSFKELFSDILPAAFCSFLMFVIIVIIGMMFKTSIMLLIIQVIVGVVSYFVMSHVFKIKSFEEICYYVGIGRKKRAK